MPLNAETQTQIINQTTMQWLQSIVQTAVALQEVGEFSSHDMEAVMEADEILTELLDTYETQEVKD